MEFVPPKLEYGAPSVGTLHPSSWNVAPPRLECGAPSCRTLSHLSWNTVSHVLKYCGASLVKLSLHLLKYRTPHSERPIQIFQPNCWNIAPPSGFILCLTRWNIVSFQLECCAPLAGLPYLLPGFVTWFFNGLWKCSAPLTTIWYNWNTASNSWDTGPPQLLQSSVFK